MRKLYLVLLALTLSFATVAMTVAPVMAAKPAEPGDNQPVAWVSLGGSNGSTKDVAGVHGHVSIFVKRLSDGTTVGHIDVVDLDNKSVATYEIVDSDFRYEGDVRVANVLAKYSWSPGMTVWAWWRFEDRGEPGAGTDYYQLLVHPLPTSVPPPWPPAWPPSGGWFPMGPGNTITDANLQLHLPN